MALGSSSTILFMCSCLFDKYFLSWCILLNANISSQVDLTDSIECKLYNRA